MNYGNFSGLDANCSDETGLEIRAGHRSLDRPKLVSDHPNFILGGHIDRPLFSDHRKQFLFRYLTENCFDRYIHKLLANYKFCSSSEYSIIAVGFLVIASVTSICTQNSLLVLE